MTRFQPFDLERWQSTYENDVDFNLSESGVHPLTLGALRALCGDVDLDDIVLGYGQTNGSAELRARIASLYPHATPENVTVTNGSAEANFASVWALAENDAAIAVIVPTYMQTPGVARAFGARVLEIPLREELGWQLDPDDVRRVMRTGVRAVVVTNPCNPTGSVLSAEARQTIIDAAAEANAWILADEVYTGAELDGPPTPTFSGSYPRTIATGSLSKACGLPGLRIGWAVTTPDMAEQIWARRDYSTIAPATPCDRLATLALEPAIRRRLLQRTRNLIHEGLAVLEPWLREQAVFDWQTPAAGAICFARLSFPVDVDALAERLRREQSLLIVPGTQFGVPNTIRFGIGGPAARLGTALARFAVTLHALRDEASAASAAGSG